MSHGYVHRYSGAEEQEYSESDCQDEGQQMQQLQQQPPFPDLSELYKRQHPNTQGRNPGPVAYCHSHMSQQYYEPQSRLPTSCACNLAPDPRYYYYKTAPPQVPDNFRSLPHVAHNLGTCQDVPLPRSKKYPITARTPRYYRCPAGAPLPKRPSTLCLPVTCQPDPAVAGGHRPIVGGGNVRKTVGSSDGRYRTKNTSDPVYGAEYALKTNSKTAEDVHPVDSEGDLNSRLNDLENLLTKFDDNEAEEEQEGDNVEIVGVNELSKILKPKIPAAIKAKQDKIQLKSAPKSGTSPKSTPNKSGDDGHLDGYIQELNNKEKNTLKSKEPDGSAAGSSSIDSKLTDQEMTHNSSLSSRRQHQLRHCYLSEQKPSLDDNSALELHKSKSYIVSLIDKALSKELGTVPGDKCHRREFIAMSPKKAIDLMNRHTVPRLVRSNNMQVASATTSCVKRAEHCECRVDEPLYLKQLKQLRWSHLRHIQREAKRLADLERFLDSFGETPESPQE